MRNRWLGAVAVTSTGSEPGKAKSSMGFCRRFGAIRVLIGVALVGSLAGIGEAEAWDGPQDNRTDQVRAVPGEGIEVPAAVRERLQAGLDRLEKAIAAIPPQADGSPHPDLVDVQIFHRAVDVALRYREFFHESEFEAADRLLAEGLARAESLAKGETPWARATGRVVRGYVSKIDGSVQPYGLEIPAGLDVASPEPTPLDVWFHGRGETLSELNFIDQRMRQPGTFAPRAAMVLHPYGRYCNANKFAGEIDVYEALESVQRRYSIDTERLAARGFSMGGASAWQIAVHDPGRWAVANPGAGFSETPEFLQTFQGETLAPYWWEARLWRWYDATEWAGNLRHVPTIAYSGEKDVQIQAALAMSRAAAREGLSLVHLIGPETGHSYHPATAAEVERSVRELSRIGRERVPRDIDFTTYTLRYGQLAWLRVLGLEEHWQKSRVKGRLGEEGIVLEVQGITGLELHFEPGTFPYRNEPEIRVRYQREGQWVESIVTTGDSSLPTTALLPTDRSWQCRIVKGAEGWRVAQGSDQAPIAKRPGMQGPIDDAFMDSFVFVEPTGASRFPRADAWARAEMQRAVVQWRRHFRGEVRVLRDVEVTAEDLEKFNVVLWGDPESNRLWQTLNDRLPLRLDGDQWTVGDQRFAATEHQAIQVYPNPEAPHRYVVTNSGFTFREFAYLNNARQVPVLPDWAIVGLDEAPGYVYPGRIAAADFFDEGWRVRLPVPQPLRVSAPEPFKEEPWEESQQHSSREDLPRRWVSQVAYADLADSEAAPESESSEEQAEESLLERRSLGEPVIGAARLPLDEKSRRFWLENAIVHHGFSVEEVQAATGIGRDEVLADATRWNLRPFGGPPRASGEPLKMLPYPGGRHPRIGFLDGAVRPQRETKVSVFTPWDEKSYVVCDFPEAIWSDLGLTYLAHTHIDTIFDRQGLRLEPQEWERTEQGTLRMERQLPNGMRFGTECRALTDHVAFRMWLVNGSDAPRSDLRVQNCVMLKGTAGFDATTNENKRFVGSLAVAGDQERRRWIISGWKPIHRTWGNEPCPCLHADPRFPDCGIGEEKMLYGWLSFHEGQDIDAELERIEGLDWEAIWRERE